MLPLSRVAEPSQLLAQPAGRFVGGLTWIYACAHPALYGTVLHGRATEAEMERLTSVLEGELAPEVPRHGSLIDASRLEGADPGAFEVLHHYVRRHHARLSTQVSRLAMVRPSGLPGALVAGFFGTLEPPYPVSVFEDAAAALAWLGEPPGFAEALAEALAEATGVDRLLGDLRALADHQLADLTVATACRALGISERSLQRRLHAAGTSFTRELSSARLRAAEHRLRESDAALTAVAFECGFSSLQHFSAAFRKATGLSPSAWRQRARAAG